MLHWRRVKTRFLVSNAAIKQEIKMKNLRLIVGVILMLLAAAIFFFNVTDYYTPIAITLLILGIVLTATARRG